MKNICDVSISQVRLYESLEPVEQAKVGLQHTVTELSARLTEREKQLETSRQARRYRHFSRKFFFQGRGRGKS